MKLTDQEQVILKAIGPNVAEVSRVIRAVRYPKATVKKVLVGLNEKGIVALHRHDWPQSLAPAERKLMVKIGSNYYNAVSVMRRNPKSKGKIAYVRWVVSYINPLYLYIKFEPALMDMAAVRRDAYSAMESEFGGTAVRQLVAKLKGDPVILDKLPADVWEVKGAKGWAWISRISKNNPAKQSKGKVAAKRAGRALKGFARGALQSGAEILGAGAMALNPTRKRKKATKKNKTIIKAGRIDHLDVAKVHNPRKRNTTAKKPSKAKRLAKLAVKGLTKKNPFSPMGFEYRKGHEFGSPPLRGQKAAKLRIRLNKLTERWEKAKTAAQLAKIKKEMDATWEQLKALGVQNPKAKRNASKSRTTKSVSKRRAGASRKTANRSRIRSVAKSRKAPVKRASSNPTRKGMRKGYGQAKALGRHDPKRKPMIRKAARRGKQIVRKAGRNPSAESIRKEFAGSVNGERDLFFPQGTPAGKLAKLGKLVSITTEEGTIKPVSGSAWLCADTRGKLHIGSTSGAPLFDGPKRSFGHVTKLEYESTKPHLGYKGPIIWFHKAGEENGIRPTLHADGKGGIVFRGGDYRLTRRGIEN